MAFNTDEKSPAALAALITGTPDPSLTVSPPPYDPSLAEPVTDEKLPQYSGPSSPVSVLTSPSTTSLASFEEATNGAPAVANKLYISQRGNTLRPWPFAYPSELVTHIYDSTRDKILYTSTRFKKCSGSGVMVGVEENGGEKIEVSTTYFWGPGNDPKIVWEGPEGKEEVMVHGKGKLTRSRYFVYKGERYEWRYKGKLSEAVGMVLQRVEDPDDVIEKVPETQCEDKGGNCKGKGKSRSRDKKVYIPIADFVRDEEENGRILGMGPAGQGGWVTIFDQGNAKSPMPDWLIVATCMVMLKRERERRAAALAAAYYGGH
ncbi:hypothetical protein BDZ91DRAFT_802082 [Kalaharituber pfeilii]|nr:hypothetical protein BDZ91DRAFT_802082 [Kalaharituber pfeilii]